ncbi:hypothetical protein LAZ67_15000367 [Cordylochernes scorpioides]|uniref:Mariner Mos1 transposase n=1 Tax=Cordylochernes scorpioides TaxID=51811 RepID=A0ABY6L805_9ARAC|nr:hypothetical protein LAZ67_15000367 [Cordylochernes scorpioides]
MFNSDPHWLKNVITEDETWVYGYDPETKRQTSQCLEPGEPRFKKARMFKSKLKYLLITFFDVKGLNCRDLIETANNYSDFLKTIITGDETWCFLFDPQTKEQSLEWHTPSSPRKKKVRLDKSKGKVRLVVFFDYQGLVYYEFIKEGVTINKQAFKEILVRLRDAIRRKINQLFKSKQWEFLHDNAPTHRAIIVQDYLTKHSVSVLPHPPYSPDIAPCDFFFIPKLKMTLKGRRFSSSSEVIENATVDL